MELVIRSNSSDRELVFSNLVRHSAGDEDFQVEIRGFSLSAKTGVYAYTDASFINAIFQELGQLDRPWTGAKTWESMEGEFSLAITCNTRGHVHFKIIIRTVNGPEPEEVDVAAGLTVDFGALPSIAKDAQKFFEKR